MADYEKKLHVASSSGAIFALKSMGWNEYADRKPFGEASALPKVENSSVRTPIAASENEVML